MSTETTTFDSWAILELPGHKKLAGRVTEVQVFGTAMLRIDIPATTAAPALTQFYGGAAVYGLHPCDEETAQAMAESIAERPIAEWSLRKMAEHAGLLLTAPEDMYHPDDEHEHFYEDDEDDDDYDF